MADEVIKDENKEVAQDVFDIEPPESISLGGKEYQLHGFSFDDVHAIEKQAKKEAVKLATEMYRDGVLSKAEKDDQIRTIYFTKMTEEELQQHNWSTDGVVYLLWRSIRHNALAKNKNGAPLTLADVEAMVDWENFAEVSGAVLALWTDALKNVERALTEKTTAASDKQ